MKVTLTLQADGTSRAAARSYTLPEAPAGCDVFPGALGALDRTMREDLRAEPTAGATGPGVPAAAAAARELGASQQIAVLAEFARTHGERIAMLEQRASELEGRVAEFMRELDAEPAPADEPGS